MKLQIESKGIELTEHLRSEIDQKLGADLEKYLTDFDEDIKIAEIRLEAESRWGYKVSFSMWLPRKEHIYAEDKNKVLETAVNSVKDMVQRELRKYKEKLQEHHD